METLNTETQGTEPQQSTQPTRPIWLIILTVSLPMFMASLDNLIVTNALPVIGRELGATFEQLSWFVNAYTLAFASLSLRIPGPDVIWGGRSLWQALHLCRGTHIVYRRLSAVWTQH